jgi:hypothetical protein
MPRSRPVVLGLAALSALVAGGMALSEIAPDGAVLGPAEGAELVKPLSQPWALGSLVDDARPIGGGGGPSVGWKSDQPAGIELSQPIVDGVSLHVGAEATLSDGAGASSRIMGPDAGGRDVLGSVDWQAGAGVRVRLDHRWTASVGASWRSERAMDSWDRSRSANAGENLDGEGVVWFALRAEF